MYENALETIQSANIAHFRCCRRRDTGISAGLRYVVVVCVVYRRGCVTRAGRCPSVCVPPPCTNVRVGQYWLPTEGCGTHGAFKLLPVVTEIETSQQTSSTREAPFRGKSANAVPDISRCSIMALAHLVSTFRENVSHNSLCMRWRLKLRQRAYALV